MGYVISLFAVVEAVVLPLRAVYCHLLFPFGCNEGVIALKKAKKGASSGTVRWNVWKMAQNSPFIPSIQAFQQGRLKTSNIKAKGRFMKDERPFPKCSHILTSIECRSRLPPSFPPNIPTVHQHTDLHNYLSTTYGGGSSTFFTHAWEALWIIVHPLPPYLLPLFYV